MDGDDLMELGCAGAVRRGPCDRFCACPRPVDPEPDLVRRIPGAWRLAGTPAVAPLGTDDTRGARKIFERHAVRSRQAARGRSMSDASASTCKQAPGVIAPVVNFNRCEGKA